MDRQSSNDSAAEVLIPRKHESSADNIPLVYGEEDSVPIILNGKPPIKSLSNNTNSSSSSSSSSSNKKKTSMINVVISNEEEQKGFEHMDDTINEPNDEADESQGFLAHQLSDAIRTGINDESEEQELGQNLVTLHICEGEAQAMIYQSQKLGESTSGFNNHEINHTNQPNINNDDGDGEDDVTPSRKSGSSKFSPVKMVVNNTVQAFTMNAKKYLNLGGGLSINDAAGEMDNANTLDDTNHNHRLSINMAIKQKMMNIGDHIADPNTLLAVSISVLSSLILEGIFCFLECRVQSVRTYVLSFFYFVLGVVGVLLFSVQHRYPRLSHYIKYLSTLEEKTYWFFILGVLSLGEEWWSLLVSGALFTAAIIHGFASFFQGYRMNHPINNKDDNNISILKDGHSVHDHLRIPGTPRHTAATAAASANSALYSVRSPQLGSPVGLGRTTTHELL